MKDLIKRISNLFSIKSIITLGLIGSFVYLICNQLEVPDTLTNILTTVVGFYFGTQAARDN